MQSVTPEFAAESGSPFNVGVIDGTLYYPVYGVNISWTKAENENFQFFTIGTSTIGGPDFIPGGGSVPAFVNQYQYTNYSSYILQGSLTRNIGQYTYGAFGAQAEVQLDNTSLLFTPGYDPTIGDFITTGRPINIAFGFLTGTNKVSETISMFYGQTTAPQNDLGTRQITLDAFDLYDYVATYTSKAQGPIAAANNGCYVNVYANEIIGDLLEEVGLASSQYIAEQSTQAPIGFYSSYNLLVGDVIQALCEAEQAIFFIDENGIAHFWNRQHMALNNSPVWTLDENVAFEVSPEDTPIINDVQVQASPRAVQSDQQIWTQTDASTILAAPASDSILNMCTNPSFENDTVGWSLASGGSITRNTSQSWTGSASGQFISTGGSGNFLYMGLAGVVPSTSYTYQIHAMATAGTQITLQALSLPLVDLGSTTITASGNWDLISVTFTSAASGNTAFYTVYTAAAATVYLDGAMASLTDGASATYFDGNTTATTSYVYSWTGSPNDSTSVATAASILTIEADFEDDFGSLPVSSVDLPIWYTTSDTTSIYQANTQPDNSGEDVSAYVVIVGTSLTNQPDDAATLSGSSYFITFVSSYPAPVYITQLVLWGTPAKITTQINYEYQNQASIALYGDNPTNNAQPLLIQNDLIQSLSTAQSNATVLATDYGTAYKRLTADIAPVPQLQIGDVVAFGDNDLASNAYGPMGLLAAITQQQQLYSATPVGLLAAITQMRVIPIYTYYTIVGISFEFSPDSPMKEVLELEEKNLVTYFTIGQSFIGGSDQIAPG